MRDLQEIRNDIERLEKEIDDAWKKAHEDELKLGKGDYNLFHKLCRDKNDLQFEYEMTKRYNVKVGDGVTVHYGSDSHAGTVIAKTKSTITIQQDKATLKEGWKPEIIPGGFVGHCVNQDSQEYDYERNEKGRIWKAHWSNVKGKFIVDGCLPVSNGRCEYYDYNF